MKNIDIQKQISGIKDLLMNNELVDDEMFDFNAACKFLKLSPSYLYKLTHKKIINFYKPGGKKLYFSKLDLIKWIKTNRSLTNQEIMEKAITYTYNNKSKT